MSYDLKGNSISQEKNFLSSRSMEVKSKVTFYFYHLRPSDPKLFLLQVYYMSTKTKFKIFIRVGLIKTIKAKKIYYTNEILALNTYLLCFGNKSEAKIYI